jgi:cation:H+ antiporter
VGILFTPWNLGFLSALSAIFALISGAVFIGFLLRKGPLRGFYLLGAGSLYAAFLAAAVVVVVGS